VNITTLFTINGNPATTLTPSLTGWRIDTDAIVTSGNMAHIANGLYKYSFSAYDDSIDYVFMADGGISLSASSEGRYQFGNNEVGQITNQADSISAVHASELAIIAGLVQRNQRITNCTYDGSNNLLSATLSIYSSASDAESQTSPIKQFSVNATYNGSNQMTDYKVKEI